MVNLRGIVLPKEIISLGGRQNALVYYQPILIIRNPSGLGLPLLFVIFGGSERSFSVFPANAGIHSCQLFIEILPGAVGLFNQFDLPSPFPSFDSLFASYGALNRFVRFIPY